MNRPADYGVVIVGSGVSGLAAALWAHERGLEPLVLEKARHVGGTTAYSYGLLWVGANHLAEADGYHDDLEAVHGYLGFVSAGAHEDARLRAFVDGSREALRALDEAGVALRIVRGVTDHYYDVAPGSKAEGRTIEVEPISGTVLGEWSERVLRPPNTPYWVSAEEMIGWGGMATAGSWDPALMAERRENDTRGLGVGLVSALLKALLDRGVEIRTGAGVERLLVDDGAVVGVRLEDSSELRARHAVLLAAGGYEASPELSLNFEGVPGLISSGPPSVTGDGLVLGAEQGAAVRQIHNSLTLTLAIEIPANGDGGEPTFREASIIELPSPHTIVVNRAGERFANEAHFQYVAPRLRDYDTAARDYRNLPCYLIFDQQYADRFSFGGNPPGAAIPDWVQRGDTVQELARAIGVHTGGLTDTVRRFNGFADAGVDEDFQRGSERWRLARSQGDGGNGNPRLGTLASPPYYGLQLKPQTTGSAGLAANEHGQVLHHRGHPIAGLYGSGNTCVHSEFGVGYQHGLTLMSGITFSYLAMRHIAEEARHG